MHHHHHHSESDSPSFDLLASIPNDISPFELQYGQRIGKGQYGTVYLGKCRGIQVAIKKLNDVNLDEETLEDFRKEVNILRQIRHPNLLLFMGACTQGGLAIVTEYLPGDNLQNVLKNPKINLSLTKRLMMAKEAAQGINWLHCMKPSILHRDIKPANLLVDKNYHIRVCDFGFAAVKEKGRKIENPDGAPGSPIWMGPEVLQGLPVDEKSDVYSFGIVLWEILTRKPPFAHHTQMNTFMRAIIEKRERPPIPDDCIPSLRELIEACWAHEPTRRPSFAEILNRLDICIVDAAISDQVGRDLWKCHFLGNYEAEWGQFVVAFYKAIGLSPPRANVIAAPRSDRQLNLLYIFLGSKSIDGTKEKSLDVVTLENFGNFLQSFGPLNASILDRLVTLCQYPWFHGKTPKDEVSTLLEKKKGRFLVRMSESEAGCFTISKGEGPNQPIVHQRILYSPKTQKYVILINNQNFEYPSLDKLISGVSSALGLKKPAKLSKFRMQLTETDVGDSYLNNPMGDFSAALPGKKM